MGSKSNSWQYVVGGDPNAKKQTTQERSAAHHKSADDMNKKKKAFHQAERSTSVGSNLKSSNSLLSGQYA